MKTHRLYAIFLRYWYIFRRSSDKMSDMFYWPTIDLLIWGVTSRYLQETGASQAVLVILSGILFWLVVWRGNYEITTNFLEELWNNNLINLFTSPLRFKEWVVAILGIGILKTFMSIVFSATLAYFLYKVNFSFYGWYLVPFSLSLLMTGWAIGFLVAGIIFRYGTRIQTLAWGAVAIISPFSGIYYPISSLPMWAQKIALVVPTSYIFEQARVVIHKGTVDLNVLLVSFALNTLYLSLAILYVHKSFQKARERGLINLY